MRTRSVVFAAAFLAGVAGSAQAQYLNPYTGNWLLNAPVTVPGIVGSGAAEAAEPQQRCVTIMGGRSGPVTRCSPAPAATPQR